MEYNKAMPTVSTKAYVDGTGLKLARLLGYYITTARHQTLLFKREILSLPYTYFQYIDSPDEMAEQMKVEMQKLLSPHYITVDVETEVQMIDEVKANIAIYASVADVDGKTYGLGNVISIDPEGLQRVVDINNYGDKDRYLGRL